MWFTKAINKGKLRSNKVAKSPRLQIEQMNSQDKTILTRTFLCNALDDGCEHLTMKVTCYRREPLK